MEIKVLGTGCPKCNKLETMVREIIAESAIDAEVIKVSTVNEIAKAGVMLTPALSINGDMKFSGKLPPRETIEKMIKSSA